jgi:hypothetical protein
LVTEIKAAKAVSMVHFIKITECCSENGTNYINRFGPILLIAKCILWETNVDKASLKHPSSPSKNEFQNAVGKLNHKVYKHLSERKDIIPRLINQIESKFFSSRKIVI